MDIEQLFLTCCGFEFGGDGHWVKFYLDGPTPEPSFSREYGVRTSLFHLVHAEDAEAVRRWLRGRRAWEVLRVPSAYSRERGIMALRIAAQWHSGQRSPLYSFASTRSIHGEQHREQLRREVNALVGSVLENPNPGDPTEYARLSLLREVVNTVPLHVELATAHEVCE